MNNNQHNNFFFPSTIPPMPQEFPSVGAPAFRNYQVKNSKTISPRGQYKPRAKTVVSIPRQGRAEKKGKVESKIEAENLILRQKVERYENQIEQLKQDKEQTMHLLELQMSGMKVTHPPVVPQELPHVPFSSPPPSVLASPVDHIHFQYHQDPPMMPSPSQYPPPAPQFYQQPGMWFQPQQPLTLHPHLPWSPGFNQGYFQTDQPSTSSMPLLQNHLAHQREETLEEIEMRIRTFGFSSPEDSKKYLERKFGHDNQLDFDATGYLFNANMFSVMKQEVRRPKPRDIHQMNVKNNCGQNSDWELMNAFEKEPWIQKTGQLMRRQAREEEAGLIIVVTDGDEIFFDEF